MSFDGGDEALPPRRMMRAPARRHQPVYAHSDSESESHESESDDEAMGSPPRHITQIQRAPSVRDDRRRALHAHRNEEFQELRRVHNDLVQNIHTIYSRFNMEPWNRNDILKSFVQTFDTITHNPDSFPTFPIERVAEDMNADTHILLDAKPEYLVQLPIHMESVRQLNELCTEYLEGGHGAHGHRGRSRSRRAHGHGHA